MEGGAEGGVRRLKKRKQGEIRLLMLISISFFLKFEIEFKSREALEVSLVDEAELVFATLSSTGRKILSGLKRGFDAVLIDEACQCSEVACLQPLIFGASKVRR